MVFGQFADATHTTVAQVVNIIHFANAVAQINQRFHHVEDVVVVQYHRAFIAVATQAAVELHTTHARQIIRVFGVEQAVEQGFYGLIGRWFARAHHAVNRNARGILIGGFVQTQGVGNVRAVIQLVGVQHFYALDACVAQFAQRFFGQLIVGFGNHFARIRIDHVFRQDQAKQVVFRHMDFLHAGFFNVTDVFTGDTLVTRDQNFAVFVHDVKTRHFTAQTVCVDRNIAALFHQSHIGEFKESCQNLFRRHADGFEQNGHRHFTATVDAEIQHVFRIKLEIQP